MEKSNKGCVTYLLRLAILAGLVFAIHRLQVSPDFGQVKQEKANPSTGQAKKKTTADQTQTAFPKVSASDWELVLVNASKVTEELNPQLSQLGEIWVDSRIVEATGQFLAAAQTLNANEQLLLGYRSVVDQQAIFDQFVAQELAADPSLTQEAAVARVQTYFEAGGTSDHQTGLGIDMSEVREVNTGDPDLLKEVRTLAAEHGFIQRYPADKEAETGVGHEDWHWRYVGVQSAKYMLEHNLSLEEYLALLEQEEAKE